MNISCFKTKMAVVTMDNWTFEHRGENTVTQVDADIIKLLMEIERRDGEGKILPNLSIHTDVRYVIDEDETRICIYNRTKTIRLVETRHNYSVYYSYGKFLAILNHLRDNPNEYTHPYCVTSVEPRYAKTKSARN